MVSLAEKARLLLGGLVIMVGIPFLFLGKGHASPMDREKLVLTQFELVDRSEDSKWYMRAKKANIIGMLGNETVELEEVLLEQEREPKGERFLVMTKGGSYSLEKKVFSGKEEVLLRFRSPTQSGQPEKASKAAQRELFLKGREFVINLAEKKVVLQRGAQTELLEENDMKLRISGEKGTMDGNAHRVHYEGNVTTTWNSQMKLKSRDLEVIFNPSTLEFDSAVAKGGVHIEIESQGMVGSGRQARITKGKGENSWVLELQGDPLLMMGKNRLVGKTISYDLQNGRLQVDQSQASFIVGKDRR